MNKIARQHQSAQLKVSFIKRAAFQLFIYMSVMSLVLPTLSVSIFAVSAEQKNLFDNNILYLDLACGSSSDNDSEASDISSVWMVGDSITEVSTQDYSLKEKFKEKDIDAEIVYSGGAGLDHAGSTGNKKSGIQSIKDGGGDIKDADAIVVAHGTNNNHGELGGLIKKALREIKKHKEDVRIFWVNTDTNNTELYPPLYTPESTIKKNRIIKNLSNELGFDVIDMAAAINPKKDLYDGIHPDSDKWANTVVEGVASASALGSGSDNREYIQVGDIPKEGKEVGASIYGGSYRGGSWKPSNKQQGSPDGHPADDPGIGNHDNKLAGTTSYAELSKSPTGLDFSALGNLPNGTKLEITYNGKSIVAEKGDVGGGGGDVKGKPRAIDLWWEAVKLLDPKGKTDLKSGVDVVKVRGVKKSTPVTPISGSAADAADSSENADGSNSPGCSCSDSASTVDGENGAVKAFNVLSQVSDLNAAAISGIIGNMMRETAGDTYDLNPDATGSFDGIVQWDSGRWSELVAWAESKGKDPRTIEAQAEYVWVEMSGDGYLMAETLSDLRNVTDSAQGAKEAAAIFDEKFERSSHGRDLRMANAERFYKEYVEGQGLTGGSADSNGSCPGGASTGELDWPDDGRKDPVTSCFGARSAPTAGASSTHGGIDIGSPEGSNVTAADGGTVEIAGDSGGFGNTVVINHGNDLWTLYGHNSSLEVSVGDKVDKGQVIAKAGSTGVSSGPHIHFNVQTAGGADYNNVVDPLDYLPEDGRTFMGSNC